MKWLLSILLALPAWAGMYPVDGLGPFVICDFGQGTPHLQVTYDTFTRADGAIGNSETSGPNGEAISALAWTTAGTWFVTNNAATCAPTPGAELWDADAAVFTAGTYGWTAEGGNTIANVGNALEVTYVDNGSGARNYLQDAKDLSSDLTVGTWYRFGFGGWVNAGIVSYRLYDTVSYYQVNIDSLTELPKQYVFRAKHAANSVILNGSMGAGEKAYWDNLSLKPLTLSHLLAFQTMTTTNVTVSVDLTLTTGCPAGVALNWDDPTSPTKGILVWHDGSSTVKLETLNAGTWTTVGSYSAAYSAGKKLTVMYALGTCNVVYNGTALVSTAVSGYGGLYSGLFNTYSENRLDNASVTETVNGTAAYPGPGTRTVVDTGSKLSVTGGWCVVTNATGNYDPKLHYGDIDPAIGQPLRMSIRPWVSDCYFGYDDDGGNAAPKEGTALFVASTLRHVRSGILVSTGYSPITAGSEYAVTMIPRSTGHYTLLGSIGPVKLMFGTDGSSCPDNMDFQMFTTGIASSDDCRRVVMPVRTWLPTPLAYDVFTGSDGDPLGSSDTSGPDSQTTPAVAWQTAGNWYITNNAATCAPTLGGDVILDGDMSSALNWTLDADWSIGGGVATKAGAATGNIYQANLTAGVWYNAIGTFSLSVSTFSFIFGSSVNVVATSGTGSFSVVGRSAGTWAGVRGGPTAAGTADDVAYYGLSMPELLALQPMSTTNVFSAVNLTLVARNPGGLALNWDDPTTPTKGVIVWHDGSGTVKLETLSSGTWTTVQSTSATYSASAPLMCRVDGTSYTVYYNNALVGSTQTVTGFTGGYCGMFNTYGGNTLDAYTCFPTGNEGQHNELVSMTKVPQ